MEEAPFFSSQGSQFDNHQLQPAIPDQENIASSPLRARTTGYQNDSGKLKKPPTVTPKRFNKFFTPRDTTSSSKNRPSKAGRQLKDITRDAINRRKSSGSDVFLSINKDGQDEHAVRPAKRRKHSFDIASSPPLSSPLESVRTKPSAPVRGDEIRSPTLSATDSDLPELLENLQPLPQPIRRLKKTGQTRRILERSFGGFDATSRGWRGSDHCANWQSETANFYTTPVDCHVYNTHRALPFCTASCNTNSLIAIGDEQGNVRMVDSAPSAEFAKTHVSFKPHRNAIMDITMSSDDMLLATSSGDQTARIVDMPTQKTKYVLTGHTASTKQVRFWPNDNNLVTTSGRDGSVQIWDLRVSAKGLAQSSIHSSNYTGDSRLHTQTLYSKDTLRVGHAFRGSRLSFAGPATHPDEALGISITSIQHLGQGREHLLVTASETHASIKLWDLRNAGRRGNATPVSSTLVPEAHKTTRDFGINAVALSGDGSRLYATCRDSIIYAYSANHLILGSAPEMSTPGTARRAGRDSKAGLGPLYGFRHPQFRSGSFYVRMALRKASADKGEMLAVGNTEANPILIPTDERYLPRYQEAKKDEPEEEDYELPSLSSTLAKSTAPSTPIYNTATPLVRAHKKEVTSLAWTYDNELVSVSDDFTVRCWREDQLQARSLRGCGEGGGMRWACGWADVEVGWDEEEC